MIRTDGAANLGGVASLHDFAGAAGGTGGPERFANFTAIDAQPPGQVGLGRMTASADPAHAARVVASYVLQD